MDIINTLSFTPHQYHQVNLCRISLQVLWLSDITTTNGKNILVSEINGECDSTRYSSSHWPNIHQPSDWTAWAIFLQQFSSRGQLHLPLGLWLDTSHQHWQYYYDPDNDCVNYREKDTWTKYWPCTTGRTRSSGKCYRHPTVVDTSPSLSTLLPTMVTRSAATLFKPAPNSFPTNAVQDRSTPDLPLPDLNL
ncbi:MAG: hypothetical protein ACK53Y_13745, partial [bacterium]